MFDVTGAGLEIGPSYNPLLRKAEGYNVETLDYADQATLVTKYAKTENVDISRIEVVDHVSDGRPMAEIIGKRHCYDFIIASHVIEHTPDLIGFLKNCEELLTEKGRLILAVPDKRSCFDVFQSLTSTGDILEAHRQKRTRPGPGSLFDAVAYGATRDGHIGWSKTECDKRQLYQSLGDAYGLVRHAETAEEYIDVHVWRFVPSSFELILNDLAEGGHTGLRIKEMHCEDEMLVALDRMGAPGRRSRLDLLEAMLDEQALSSLDYAALSRALQSARDVQARQEAELQDLRSRLAAVVPDLETALQAGKAADQLNQQRSLEAAHLQAELGAREREIMAIHHSRSWRMTHPLRRLAIFLRPGRSA
jgi:SAM-dependent methyltransferase